MRSLRGARTRWSLKVGGILAAAVGIAAVAYVLFMFGSRVASLVGSAEMAAGAVLQAKDGWALPTVLTLTVFAMTVVLVLILSRGPKAQPRTPIGSRVVAGALPATFELRSPERALAEAGKGMLRFVE